MVDVYVWLLFEGGGGDVVVVVVCIGDVVDGWIGVEVW